MPIYRHGHYILIDNICNMKYVQKAVKIKVLDLTFDIKYGDIVQLKIYISLIQLTQKIFKPI